MATLASQSDPLAVAVGAGGAGAPGAGGASKPLSPTELADLIGAFNDTAGRLQATHEALHGEVRTLKAELVEANQQVERSRRLAALGEMAAGIAHEVRNPLGSIGLYARMLQQDLTDRPQQRDVARKIADAVSRLNGVVGDVLTFAREIKLRTTRVDTSTLLGEALAAARGQGAEWQGVTINIPDEPGLEVDCDPALLHRALLNVIRNAVEAMADSPTDSPRLLSLDARPHAQRRPSGPAQAMIALSIRDTGPGIPPEVRERMFNPFFTTRAAGTGLGLAIVHRIVDAHGGRTAVRNVRGGGALVELLLPAPAA